MILTKKFRIIYKEDKISIFGYDETFGNSKTYVGTGCTGVEFDTKQEYDAYIAEHKILFQKSLEM